VELPDLESARREAVLACGECCVRSLLHCCRVMHGTLRIIRLAVKTFSIGKSEPAFSFATIAAPVAQVDHDFATSSSDVLAALVHLGHEK
jgi:hypothetical protein